MVLYGPQGNSLGLLYALANKFTVFSQVYSTTGKQVSPPSSPSAALANFLYQPTLCLMQNFSPITYPSKGIRWLLCECELVTICVKVTLLTICYWFRRPSLFKIVMSSTNAKIFFRHVDLVPHTNSGFEWRENLRRHVFQVY